MPLPPFGWKNAPSTQTPVSASELEAFGLYVANYFETGLARFTTITLSGGISGGTYCDLTRATPAYSASITPDASQGPWQTITVTNTTAFTVNAPINPPSASATRELTVEVLNSSGGVMGAITWNAAFVFATGAWTNPANTKKRFARFEWNSVNWVCTSLASADY